MSRSRCAYCNTSKPLTPEPLWPASLQSLLVNAVPGNTKAFWLARRRKTIPSEPLIRDVCEGCNHGVLAELDAYICELFVRTLFRMPAMDASIDFEYDYHLLKRWLLKMCFNSARLHNSSDRIVLEALVPYILGKDDYLGRSTQLFLRLCYPQEIPRSEIHPATGVDGRVILYPEVNRIGFLGFTDGSDRILLRSIHLRSFNFIMTIWPLGKGKDEQNQFQDVLTQRLAGTIMLQHNLTKITLVCNGMGAWDVFKASQGNDIVFDANE